MHLEQLSYLPAELNYIDISASYTFMRTCSNQYVELVKSLPDLIISGETDKTLPAEKQAILNQKISQFSKIVCELGSGSGGHLVALAQRDPETLHIGFELRFKRVFKSAEKAAQLELSNVAIMQFDANLIESIFAQSSLHAIYINFPDPWSKRRWHKHRIIKPEFLTRAAKLLSHDGFIAYKSDHREYFELSEKMFRSDPNYCITEYSQDLHSSPFVNNNLPTEFERLFLSQGLPIYYLKAALNHKQPSNQAAS